MSIPALNKRGELPPGEHEATMEEVEMRFGVSNGQRKKLMRGLKAACENFWIARVNAIWIDGSFITDKYAPNDIDGCWEYNPDVVVRLLDPVFLSHSRRDMKAKYGLDFFSNILTEGATGLPFPAFFQRNRDGEAKGIIKIKIGECA